MTIAALVPSGTGSPDGLAYDVVTKVNEAIAAINATDAISTSVPDTAIPDLGSTADLTAVTAHTAATAIAAEYADLAAARTSVNTLRTDLEAALDEVDARDTTLRAEVEARLDAIEAKVDAVLAMARTIGLIEP